MKTTTNYLNPSEPSHVWLRAGGSHLRTVFPVATQTADSRCVPVVMPRG